MEEVETAWNSHDMRRFAACFAEDADFVNVGGVWIRGREEIEEKHARSHAGRFKGSTMQMKLAALKGIVPGVAVAHVTWRMEGHQESGPKRTTGTRIGIWTWTVRDRGGRLEIIASHNTDTLRPDAANE